MSQTLSQTQVTNFELTHGSIQTAILTSMNFQIKKHAKNLEILNILTGNLIFDTKFEVVATKFEIFNL